MQNIDNTEKETGISERDNQKNIIQTKKINVYNSHAIATRRRNYEGQQLETNENPINSGISIVLHNHHMTGPDILLLILI